MNEPKALADLANTNPVAHALVVDHLTSGTSSVWLSRVLTKYEHPVSETTLRAYRRHLNGV